MSHIWQRLHRFVHSSFETIFMKAKLPLFRKFTQFRQSTFTLPWNFPQSVISSEEKFRVISFIDFWLDFLSGIFQNFHSPQITRNQKFDLRFLSHYRPNAWKFTCTVAPMLDIRPIGLWSKSYVFFFHPYLIHLTKLSVGQFSEFSTSSQVAKSQVQLSLPHALWSKGQGNRL